MNRKESQRGVDDWVYGVESRKQRFGSLAERPRRKRCKKTKTVSKMNVFG